MRQIYEVLSHDSKICVSIARMIGPGFFLKVICKSGRWNGYLSNWQVKNTTMHSCNHILPLFLKAKASMNALREVFAMELVEFSSLWPMCNILHSIWKCHSHIC
jgi:hypothetical protein